MRRHGRRWRAVAGHIEHVGFGGVRLYVLVGGPTLAAAVLLVLFALGVVVLLMLFALGVVGDPVTCVPDVTADGPVINDCGPIR